MRVNGVSIHQYNNENGKLNKSSEITKMPNLYVELFKFLYDDFKIIEI